jgi:hypothetical protein
LRSTAPAIPITTTATSATAASTTATATAPSASTITTAPAASTTAAAAACLALASFANLNVPTLKHLARGPGDRRLSRFRRRHRDKRKPAGPPGGAVGNQIGFGHRPKFSEQVLEIILRDIETEVADK